MSTLTKLFAFFPLNFFQILLYLNFSVDETLCFRATQIKNINFGCNKENKEFFYGIKKYKFYLVSHLDTQIDTTKKTDVSEFKICTN